MIKKSLYFGTRGFTLIELLVVISTIGMLSSIILVSLNGARAKAKTAGVMAFAANMYHAMGANAVLALSFDEGSGIVARDVSLLGNNNDATVPASGTTWSSDTYSQAGSKYSMYFNGSTGLTFNKRLGLSNSNFTIAHWIKTSSNASQMYTVGNDYYSGNGFRFGLSSGVIWFLIGNSSYTYSNCGTVVVNDDSWHHIVGVFDRTSRLFTCYLDGKQVGTAVLASDFPNMSDRASDFGVGKPPCCTPFVGYLDDVIIYAQNLSGISIRELYESSKGKYLSQK
ncbi:MAG: prepilin-type N-terminal cleavage/methylation domain-containing protein [Candidatus Taylorbacteria bacterium]|nr:prepilin-type N-terminal cleavage/methylation domain-containing protein [Candidatus Taylorbacteria bacterium]